MKKLILLIVVAIVVVATRKKKTKKDDEIEIKKPTSAYIFFVADYRKVLKRQGVNIHKVQMVAKLCGEKWKSMTEQQKEPYRRRYQEDKARYLREKQQQEAKDRKGPNKIKKPQTAYFFFLADFRKQMAGKKLSDEEKIPSLAIEKWRTMSSQTKKKYEEMAAKDKIRYQRELKSQNI